MNEPSEKIVWLLLNAIPPMTGIASPALPPGVVENFSDSMLYGRLLGTTRRTTLTPSRITSGTASESTNLSKSLVVPFGVIARVVGRGR